MRLLNLWLHLFHSLFPPCPSVPTSFRKSPVTGILDRGHSECSALNQWHSPPLLSCHNEASPDDKPPPAVWPLIRITLIYLPYRTARHLKLLSRYPIAQLLQSLLIFSSKHGEQSSVVEPGLTAYEASGRHVGCLVLARLLNVTQNSCLLVSSVKLPPTPVLSQASWLFCSVSPLPISPLLFAAPTSLPLSSSFLDFDVDAI